MTLENLLGYSDGYMAYSNNYFLYKDPNQAGRYTWFQADMDSTTGISFIKQYKLISGNYAKFPNIFRRPLTRKILSYPKYLDTYQELLLNLTKTLINPTILDPYIDSLVNMIRPDVEWDATLPRVGKTIDPFASSNIITAEASKLVQAAVPKLVQAAVPRPNVTFDVAVNGPIKSDYLDSVKGFFAKKSTNILEFYKHKSA
jgi:hypothetical protein